MKLMVNGLMVNAALRSLLDTLPDRTLMTLMIMIYAE